MPMVVSMLVEILTRNVFYDSGVEGAVIVGKLLEGEGGSWGYNAATNVYEDLVKAGIIDPLKVALRKASPTHLAAYRYIL